MINIITPSSIILANVVSLNSLGNLEKTYEMGDF